MVKSLIIAATIVYGTGTQPCSTWTRERTQADLLAHASWVSGYMSAFNMFGPGDGDALKLAGVESARRWIDTYCQKHPKDQVSTASFRLIEKLSPPHK